MGRIRDYFSKWLERMVVEPLYVKFSARMDARLADDEKRLETSVEGLKANAKQDLASVVGSASAGLTNEFQDLKKNFSYLNEHFDRFVKNVDSRNSQFTEKISSEVGEAVKKINSCVEKSENAVLEANSVYESARLALEDTKAAFESVRQEMLDLQTQYKLDYASFLVAAKSVQESLAGLEKKVDNWSIKAHELLSVDLTAERLDAAHEGGERLLNSIQGAKSKVKEDILVSVKADLSVQIAALSNDLSLKLQSVADERAYNLMVYALEIPENRRGIVAWVADYNGNYELVRAQLKDGSARGWLTRFEKDVKDKNMNLKYLADVVKLIGYRQKNLKPS